MADVLSAFSKLSEKHEIMKAIKKSLEYIDSRAVYVGIPRKNNSRERSSEEGPSQVTNAELLFIHTNGSPINNIPPRPVIEPAIKNDQQRLNKMFNEATISVIKGKCSEADKKLEEIGIRGQNVSRAWFTNPDNGWAPNSPVTIKAKGSSRPLIDTGELRKSITYVVDKGGKR